MKIPEMTPESVHTYLREIGSQWTGQGVAIELGSWLGASAVPLLEGLVKAGYNLPFYSYDKWRSNGAQMEKSRDQGVQLTMFQNLLPIFMSNVTPIYQNVIATRGNISETIKKYNGDPIEICIFDAPKREPVFGDAIKALKDHWIPGVTILGLLDYHFYQYHEGKEREDFLAPVRFIDAHKDNFIPIKEWPLHECSCMFFKYIKKI
jgi:hypothetical protein